MTRLQLRSRQLRRRRQAGLTLVEIIIVLVILSLVMTFLTGGLFGQGEKAKAKINSIRMQKLQSALQEYQLMYNSIPQSLNALTSCSEQTGAGCVPVITDEEELRDAWGTPFQYQANNFSYTLTSLGSDRREGGSGTASDVTIEGP